MYRSKAKNQVTLDSFILPFGGKLSADNRWVKMAELMPWNMVEEVYNRTMKFESKDGRPPIPSRIAYGAIFIKGNEDMTDEKTLECTMENPYVQYFLGLTEFRKEPLFDPSMMVHFRKRFPAEEVEKINEELFRRMNEADDKPSDEDMPDEPGEVQTSEGEKGNKSKNEGTLILDATVSPADIRYPTDLSILNECRENTERIIEELWLHSSRKGHKTTYNRKKARRNFLKVTKQRKPRKGALGKAIREQLEYTEQSMETIDRLLMEVCDVELWIKHCERLRVIRIVCEQQRGMLEKGIRSCEDRIVNLRQPHVRPMVRGKAGAPVEFGQKLALSVIKGFTFIERQSWDNFNEGITLIDSLEKYRKRHGCWPEAVLADTIYRTRDNRRFCKENGIRLSGPRLGRPKKEEIEADKHQAYQDSCDRNMVESRNGIAKRRYGLDRIFAYGDKTAETEAAMIVFAMNMAWCLRTLSRIILEWFKTPLFGNIWISGLAF